MKKLLVVFSLIAVLVLTLAISVSAADADPCDAEYYNKVYVSTSGVEMQLYEKVGDTYYPLVWFAYDVTDEGGATETKYVKVHFEDVTAYSYEPGQGRFNGLEYNYVDENGDSIFLDSSNAVLINMRGGVMSNTKRIDGSARWTNVTIKTTEWSKSGYPKFPKIEAIYLPLTITTASQPSSSLRVMDIDRHHTATISMPTQAFYGAQIKEIFVPGSTKFNNGNSQFKSCRSLETIIFGTGFAANNPTINGYTFQDTPLKRIYFMDSKEALDSITVVNINNAPFFDLEQISLTNYLALDEEVRNNGKYLVYDVTECFLYGHTSVLENDCVGKCSICGETLVNHDANAELNVSVVYTDFTKAGKEITACASTGCNYCVEKTLKPIFYWGGYSAKTFGEYGFGQQYIINTEELASYKAYLQTQGKTFSYGVVAAGASSAGQPLYVVDGVVTNKPGAESITFDNVSYDAFFMNITGMGEENLDVALVCCAYVQLGDEVVYLDNNETVSTVTLKTYNQIDAIVNPKEEL